MFDFLFRHQHKEDACGRRTEKAGASEGIPAVRRSPARLPMRMKRALTVVGSINGKSLKDNVKGRPGMRP